MPRPGEPTPEFILPRVDGSDLQFSDVSGDTSLSQLLGNLVYVLYGDVEEGPLSDRT